MTTQLALPGLASDAALRARALVIYIPLYGCDPDTAAVGVETMLDVYGGWPAVVTELERRAGQAETVAETQTAA